MDRIRPVAPRVGANLDAGFGWEDFDRLRAAWKGKLVVKGVNHPKDARVLMASGADGLWVSNHGGRQLDGALASIDALAAIRDAVPPGTPLMLDSGIRRGSDLLKARAGGASLGAIGRAALYGAVAGAEGPAQALDLLLEELRLAMKLAGQPVFRAVGPDLLAPDARDVARS